MTPQEFKAIRRGMKLNQSEFGEKIGVTRQTVGLYERGLIGISKMLEILLKLLTS